MDRANLKRTFEKLASLEPFCERFSTKNCNFAASNRINDDTRKAKSDYIPRRGNRSRLKESKDSLARKVYESICAFLNRRGGHVVLGVDNDRNVVGINPSKVQEQLDQLAKDMNNPQLFKPTYYLNFEPMDLDGKKVIYFYVPESTQGHSYKGVFYDRNQDGDFELRSTEQIANLFIRKSKLKTEDRVYPMF